MHQLIGDAEQAGTVLAGEQDALGVESWLIDPDAQTLPGWRGRVDVFAATPQEIGEALAAAREEIDTRARDLAACHTSADRQRVLTPTIAITIAAPATVMANREYRLLVEAVARRARPAGLQLRLITPGRSLADFGGSLTLYDIVTACGGAAGHRHTIPCPKGEPRACFCPRSASPHPGPASRARWTRPPTTISAPRRCGTPRP